MAFEIPPGSGTRVLASRRSRGARAFLAAIAIVTVGCSGAERAAKTRTAVTPDSSTSATQPPPSAVPSNVWPEPLAPPGRLAGKRICIDPGHDAYWGIGATGRDRRGAVPLHPVEGVPLNEHELTLAVATRLAARLEHEGAAVCVTRRPDGSLQTEPYDFTGDGIVRPDGVALVDGPERTQPRIDWANRFGAEILISIHFNSLADGSARGTEVYYSDVGPNAERGIRLAEHLLDALLAELIAAGYPATSRGVRSDRYQRYSPEVQASFRRHNAATITKNGADPNSCPDCERIGVLGNNPMSLTRGTYTGALVEVEFLSNPAVVEELLLRPDSLDLIATGLANGVLEFFAGS